MFMLPLLLAFSMVAFYLAAFALDCLFMDLN